MACRRIWLGWLGVLAGLLWATTTALAADDKRTHWTSDLLPLDQVADGVRERVRLVVDRPTVYTRGPAEEFPCHPAVYFWLLEHPDRAILAWRRLGARCLDVTDQGNGRFSCGDTAGNEIHWDTVYCGPRYRIWYAEGTFHPGRLIPTIHVQAVVVLRHIESRDENDRPVMRHQADLMIHTDSRAVAAAAKLFGASTPRLAEQYLSQLERFFSALACYLDQHPDRSGTLLADTPLSVPGAAPAGGRIGFEALLPPRQGG
jgi:hypothetical protein